MRALSSEPMKAAEQKFWSKMKNYFFCDEDEQLHSSDVILLGIVATVVFITLCFGAVIMIANR